MPQLAMAGGTAIDPKREVTDVLTERGEVGFPDLLNRLKEKGLDDDVTIKAAVWSLIAEAVVELTSHRKLRLVPGAQA